MLLSNRVVNNPVIMNYVSTFRRNIIVTPSADTRPISIRRQNESMKIKTCQTVEGVVSPSFSIQATFKETISINNYLMNKYKLCCDVKYHFKSRFLLGSVRSSCFSRSTAFDRSRSSRWSSKPRIGKPRRSAEGLSRYPSLFLYFSQNP